MLQAILSAKNQIVIPREAREALGIQAGDKLLIVVRGESHCPPETKNPSRCD
jgi:AbrB family looped-hinge helix DNA binding protein